MLSPGNERLDKDFDVRINQRFAAADAYNGRAALVHGGQALVDRKPAGQRVGIFADPAAAGAGQIAGVQRLEH